MAVSGVSSSRSIYGNRNVITGLASGMDTEGMIENAISAYKNKISALNQKRTKTEWKQDAYRSMINKMSSFLSKYTSYRSSNNLMSASFFDQAVKTVTKGANKDLISATGRASSDVRIDRVKQLATAATYKFSGTALDGTTAAFGQSSVIAAADGTLDLDKGLNIGKLNGSLTLKYGGANAESSLTIEFDETKPYLDDVDAEGNVTKSAAQKLVDDINKQLSEQDVSIGTKTYTGEELLNNVIKAELGENGQITFKDPKGNGVYVSSASGTVKEHLLGGKEPSSEVGKQIKSLSVSPNALKITNMTTLDYLSSRGASLEITLDGKTKTIQLPGKDDIDEDLPRAERDEAYLAKLQESIDEAFGKGKLTVSDKNGSESGIQFQFEAPKGSTFAIGSTKGEILGFGGLSNCGMHELGRVLFGIKPDEPYMEPEPEPDKAPPDLEPTLPPEEDPPAPDSVFRPETVSGFHTLPIDFETLIEREEDEGLKSAHQWFAQREPTPENLWTGYFEGKNLVWIVAEGFSTLAMDPERTPTLWKLSHQGFVFDHFYTPLWGVSTSDGEYVTTTGLIPKSGVWSYSLSSENEMPFALGNQFRRKGYQTFAFHNYLYNYYDRDRSHPNMGYEYYALGQGLELEEIWPPSDLEMMEKIVPMFANEDQFMVYCLTVSGHLTYTQDTNAMSARHWEEVSGLPYSEEVRCYLACQMELELAMESLLGQLEAAGKLDDTVIVLSADHYPYGLTDEQYSELLGHEVDPVFEIFQNTLILWSGDMEGTAVHVDKYCSSLDVMPTLSNLFGLDYDSRLIIGSDILSAEDPLVIFANYSFINGEGYYNSVLDQFTRWDGAAPDLEEVAGMVADVQNRVAYSATILDTDYYRLVLNGPPKAPKA